MTLRQDKVSELLRELCAEFISREAGRQSLITVTRVTVSRDLKNATMYISVFPEKSEEHALNFCKRKLSELRDYVKPKLHMKSIPYFDCELDLGEKNRQNIDRISSGV